MRFSHTGMTAIKAQTNIPFVVLDQLALSYVVVSIEALS